MKTIIAALPVLLDLWKSVLPLMFLGCFLGRLSLNTALIRQLGRVMRPLARLGNLPSVVDAPLTLCLVNEVAAYSMLAELRNNSIVNMKEVVLFFLVSNLPKGLYNMVFYMAPVVLGALGMRLGLIYLLMYLGVFSSAGLVGLFLGRLLLSPQSARHSSEQLPQPTSDPLSKRIIDAAKGSLPSFGRLVAIFVPLTFLVITLMQTETVTAWLSLVDPVLRRFGLPAPVLIVITTGMLSMVAGIGTLGPFLKAGIVTPVEAITALLLASSIHYFLSFWSSNLPLSVSFFGPRLGSRAGIANLVVLEGVTCLVLGVVVLFK